MHELRHTFATLMIASKKSAQRILGHSIIAQTFSYVHKDPQKNIEAVSIVNNVLEEVQNPCVLSIKDAYD